MRSAFRALLFLGLVACPSKKDSFSIGGTETGGVSDDSGSPVDVDGDGYAEGVDCDDTDALVHPEAEETCDGLDNDCDGEVDGSESVDAATWYADMDGDGYGDSNSSVLACEQPSRFVANVGDCDDASTAFHPDAVEDDCTDPTDYNCDGSVAYEDADGDGWAACEDCDDSDSGVHPDSEEICDYLDNDCDGEVDEDVLEVFFRDDDQDGYGQEFETTVGCEAPSGYVAEQSDGFDCNDNGAEYYPSAPETDCSDPNDYNCDGSVAYADADGDGWGACEECNDADPAIRPDATEVCNGIDDNCNGDTDAADATLDLTTLSTWYSDVDGDGFGDSSTALVACFASSGAVLVDGDCNDGDASIYPGAPEICDGFDSDCDSLIPADETTDGDGDGVVECADCDDANSTVSPGATELCDSLDNDCDGLIPANETTDGDNDGVFSCADCDDGDATRYPGATEECDGVDNDCDGALSADEITDGDSDGSPFCEDCDDGDPLTFPGASEACDGLDNDCDGTVPADETDGDADSWLSCEDCDDNDPLSFPGASEACDGLDNDCDGAVPADEADADSDSWLFCEECDDSNNLVNPGAVEDCSDGIDNDCDGDIDVQQATCPDFYFGITTSSADINLATLSGNPTTPVFIQVRVHAGVTVESSSTSSPALSTSGLPSGSTVELTNEGTIQGRGGDGACDRAGAGGDGGDALEVTVDLLIDNTAGAIYGGGGGGGSGDDPKGGGGGAGGGQGCDGGQNASGGNGGDGHSRFGSIPGGQAANYDGSAGTGGVVGNPGTAGGGGSGGAAQPGNESRHEGQGGAGGGWGGGGGGGSAHRTDCSRNPGPGGDAGYAVRVVSGSLTWAGGDNTTQVKGWAQ